MIALAERQGLQVRLMGGLAFHARCPDWTARINRSGRDLDLATRTRDRKALAELLVANGYTADKQYNALYGHKQLYFVDVPHERPVDVLVDALEMCHKFSFMHRLDVTETTLALADLSSPSCRWSRSTARTCSTSWPCCRNTPSPRTTVVAWPSRCGAITEFTSSDWGWWRTATGNLDKLVAFLDDDVAEGELEFGRPARQDARANVLALRAAIDAAPKSTR